MPSGTNVTLRDVWGSSSSDVFAVGDNGTILHFDGSRWSAMSSPTADTLRGISGTSPDNVYASGDNGTALRYDGTTWTVLDPQTSNNLGPVGAWHTYGAFVDRDVPGLIRVYDDGSGSWFSDDTRTGAVINDLRWIPETADDRPVDQDFFLVGDAGAGFYNEGGWQPLEVGTADLVSVFGTAPGNAFVLDEEGVLWHFRGSAQGIPVASVGASTADAVQRVYDEILLFGAGGGVFRYDRCGVTEVRSGVTADFLAAWAEPGGDVIAVGDAGTILRYREVPARTCPDNLVVRIGPGASPTIKWWPPCPVSKLMITALEGFGQGNWFIAADGNHIHPGLRIGEVPECASEIRPMLSPMEPGRLYRLTLVRRDIEGDLAVGFYNFRPGDQSNGIAAAAGGPNLAPAAGDGVYVQPLEQIVPSEPGQPLVMRFTDPERWLAIEFEADAVDGPTPVLVRELVRDPETGEVRVVQLDDVRAMQFGDAFAVYWPQLTE
jgi:hypothetical protein